MKKNVQRSRHTCEEAHTKKHVQKNLFTKNTFKAKRNRSKEVSVKKHARSIKRQEQRGNREE